MRLERLDRKAASLRLDLPPHQSSYVDLPESFGRRFTVSIDTEEEFDWGKPFTRGPHGTGHGSRFPDIQRLLGGAGVTPLYLIDYPIADDPRCTEQLREWQERGECDVGTHLHPWVNPPFDEEVNGRNSFAGNLPIELERAKLLRLTDRIEEALGRRPTVYRAGRYGVGPNSGQLLVDAGYTVDCSVRPHHDYSNEGGPDFRDIEPRPYWVGEGDLLQVPLTVGFTGLLRSHPELYARSRGIPRAHGVLARAHLLNRVAISPEGMPLPEVLEALDRLCGDGLRLFSLSFHSPSIEPGHTDYVRDEKDLRDFHAWWGGVFDYFAAKGIEPASIGEIAAAAESARYPETLAPLRAIG